MKKLAITLVIVIGLLVVADFGAAAVAEYQVAKQTRSQLKLPEDPAVRINGFPFLAQAAAGDYRDIQLSAQSVPVGQLKEVGVEANLRHARVSTADVISGKAKNINVDEVAGRIRLKSSDVGRMIGINDLHISPAPKESLDEAGSGAGAGGGDSATSSGSTVDRSKSPVQLDGTLNIAGRDVQVKVVAVLSLLNGQLKIEPRELDLADSKLNDIPLGKVFEKSILQQFSTTLDPGMLPFEITPTAVRAERDALVVEGTTNNVTIGSGGVRTG